MGVRWWVGAWLCPALNRGPTGHVSCLGKTSISLVLQLNSPLIYFEPVSVISWLSSFQNGYIHVSPYVRCEGKRGDPPQNSAYTREGYLSYFLLFILITYYSLKKIIMFWSIANLGFPGSSAGKESACNEGDPSLIPGLGRSPRGGHGNPL